MEDERDIEYGTWNRNDLFRLEKGVMAFGWGRWEEVLSHAQLRKGWTNNDVEVKNYNYHKNFDIRFLYSCFFFHKKFI